MGARSRLASGQERWGKERDAWLQKFSHTDLQSVPHLTHTFPLSTLTSFNNLNTKISPKKYSYSVNTAEMKNNVECSLSLTQTLTFHSLKLERKKMKLPSLTLPPLPYFCWNNKRLNALETGTLN